MQRERKTKPGRDIRSVYNKIAKLTLHFFMHRKKVSFGRIICCTDS